MSDERLRQLYQRGIVAREESGGVACEVAPEELLALVRGELSEERRLELLDQVMSSERCRAELELMRAVDVAGRDLTGRDLTGRDLERRIMPRMRHSLWRRGALPVALAATAVLAVGLAQYTRRDPPTADVTRGAAGGVAVVAPAEEVAPGAPPEFVWRSVPGATRYSFELLDADGNLLHSTVTTDTVAVLPDGVTLRGGGNYRWIVRATDSTGGDRASAVRRLRVRPM